MPVFVPVRVTPDPPLALPSPGPAAVPVEDTGWRLRCRTGPVYGSVLTSVWRACAGSWPRYADDRAADQRASVAGQWAHGHAPRHERPGTPGPAGAATRSTRRRSLRVQGRRGDLLKILWHDGLGMSLYAKRLERGRFLWPSPRTGAWRSLRPSSATCWTASTGVIRSTRGAPNQRDNRGGLLKTVPRQLGS